ncbi:MAG: RNA polymerase sigma factor [Planctomycetes bacterium]|nr:RNA polymerase sigma factor [Planctomycetota bacterium]
MAQRLTEPKLREWIRRLTPRLINVSAAICRDRDRAQEIVQEAFIKLWQRPPEAGEAAYASWLRRVTTNLSINAVKRTPRPGTLPACEQDPSLHTAQRPEADCEHAEMLQRVRAAMEQLDEPKRAILVLRAYEQLSYEEIAEHLGVPLGTVMSRLNRARRALLEALQRDACQADGEPMVFQLHRYRLA